MRAAAVIALALVAGTAVAAPFPAAPFRIDHTFEPTGYRARIALDDPRFVGHIEIDGTLGKPTTLLWLHGVGLTVQRARAVGPHGNVALEVSPPRGDQKIGLRAPRPLPAGYWTLVLDYTGTIYDYLAGEMYDPIARRAHLAGSLGGGARLHHDYDDDRVLRFDDMPINDWFEGACVLDLVEAWLGPDAVQLALRAYVTSHANGNVTMADLFAALDDAAGQGTGAVVEHLVDGDAFPRLAATLVRALRRRPLGHARVRRLRSQRCARRGLRSNRRARVRSRDSRASLPRAGCFRRPAEPGRTGSRGRAR